MQRHDLKGIFPTTIVQQVISVDITGPPETPVKCHIASQQKQSFLGSSPSSYHRDAAVNRDTKKPFEQGDNMNPAVLSSNTHLGAPVFLPRGPLMNPPRPSDLLTENMLPHTSQDGSIDDWDTAADAAERASMARREHHGGQGTDSQDDLDNIMVDLNASRLDASSGLAPARPRRYSPPESRLPIARHGTHRTQIPQAANPFGHRLRQSLDAPTSKGSLSAGGSALGVPGSQSTPNLLQFLERGAPMVDQDLQTTKQRSIPPQQLKSRFSASTVSSISSLSDHPPVGISAGEEYLRFRNSPLDQLAEDLSRLELCIRLQSDRGSMAESSVSSRGRQALLSGNPFDTDSEYSDDERHDSFIGSRISLSIDEGHKTDQSRADETRLPSFSPAPSRSSIASPQRPTKPTTARHLRTPSSGAATSMYHKDTCKSTPKVQSPPSARAARSLARLKRPLKTVKALMTPRVHVYDDSQPPSCQPQTPADVLYGRSTSKVTATTAPRSSRRKNTTDRQVSPSGQPSRYRDHPHRHTYPISSIPTTTETSASGSTTMAAVRTPRRTIHLGIHSARRPRRPAGRHSEEENAGAGDEMLGLLDEMQRERRIWEARRAREGNLEMTPPEEGRFERLLR